MTLDARKKSEHRSAVVQLRQNHSARSHAAPAATVDVVVIGHTGQVGSELVASLARLKPAPGQPRLLLAEGINRSKHLLIDDDQTREHSRAAGALSELGRRLSQRERPAIVVDCTADPQLSRYYPEWLRAGFGVVTPNKHGFAGDISLYRTIQQAAVEGRAPLGYSATVGAGLPILSSLKRLRAGGKQPESVFAVVSGTLSHVFSRLSTGLSLSAAVEDARARGYTEPDPLEDLSGRDVERKLLIMLRESGLDNASVHREPVVDDYWAAAARGEGDVIAALRSKDAIWAQRRKAAQAAGKVWVYLAQSGPGGARVGPVEVEQDSPFAQLSGSGNLAHIRLPDDPQTPLTIHGPGAGVAVTAGAVLADVVDAGVRLGNQHDNQHDNQRR